MIKHIFNVFDCHREVVTREMKTKFAVYMFTIKFKRW